MYKRPALAQIPPVYAAVCGLKVPLSLHYIERPKSDLVGIQHHRQVDDDPVACSTQFAIL